MKPLKDILYKVTINAVVGSTSIAINKIEFDSRKIESNDVFVAIVGAISDGHDYINKAISDGAKAIVCQMLPEDLVADITYIEVENSNKALAFMAANYYENPSENLKLVGTTGTNGKTTVSSLLYQLFKKAGYKVGLLSTVKIMVDNTEYKATHTTPDSLTINKYLQLMSEDGVEFCFMEVSSHGIHQSRTEGLYFTGGIFTNLSHDHLDYHNSFAEYRDVKKAFFDALPKTAFCLVNTDDKNSLVMIQNTNAKKYTYALKTYADYKAQILENQFGGLLLKLNDNEVWTKLIGNFNAYNLLAIYATSELLGLDNEESLRYISELESVSGRFEYFVSEEKITAIVDYAHTPQALELALAALRMHTQEQLWCVFGCGGERDAGKRPLMGAAAARFADHIVLTDDNPRGEDPGEIVTAIRAAIIDHPNVWIEHDRARAIRDAVLKAGAGDIVLVAGKGHEAWQWVAGESHPFSDRAVVKAALGGQA